MDRHFLQQVLKMKTFALVVLSVLVATMFTSTADADEARPSWHQVSIDACVGLKEWDFCFDICYRQGLGSGLCFVAKCAEIPDAPFCKVVNRGRFICKDCRGLCPANFLGNPAK
eukprot:TRINITY_DN29034_c0_g1_i1.p1 TRINITY_DN29034_c0_g1~~TRINITY_DN29034_c0_g1_i1.p1  ORF type:complete len:114 (-),score=16.73 TRINITY_DN29034_c0_g1_i1:54-395(-)